MALYCLVHCNACAQTLITGPAVDSDTERVGPRVPPLNTSLMRVLDTVSAPMATVVIRSSAHPACQTPGARLDRT